MRIVGPAKAGSLESNDIYVMVFPNDDGNEIEIESIVIKQFGKRIREVIQETLKELDVENAKVVVKDRGHLIIQLRLELKRQ